MVCCDLLFYWIRLEYPAIRKHKYLLKKQNTEINEIEAGQDQIDSSDTKSQVTNYTISIENRLMYVWALIEMILLTIVLFLKKGDGYPNNFYKDIFNVDNNHDQEVINKMIAVRLLSGFLFFLGARMVRMTFSNSYPNPSLNQISFS